MAAKKDKKDKKDKKVKTLPTKSLSIQSARSVKGGLKIGEVKGESTDRKHPTEIDI